MTINDVIKELEEELKSLENITEDGDPDERFESYDQFEGYENGLNHALRLIKKVDG